MYLPPHFREERRETLHALMRQFPLATLVLVSSQGLSANHIPLLLHLEAGAEGTLRGHVSRANPLWREAGQSVDALAIFTAPNAYITPSWYPSKTETGKAVPTWNYAAVHAWGPLHAVEDAGWLRDHVERLTQAHEAGRPTPWAVSDAPEDYIVGMLKGVVGIEIPIRRIEGKWKMSQNRSSADRAGVVRGLKQERNPVAEWITVTENK